MSKNRLITGLLIGLCVPVGCSKMALTHPENKPPAPVLQAMSVSWGASLKFEQDFLASFGKRNNIKTQFVPNSRLAVYLDLLQKHTKAPDLLQIDVVWPSILADDLVDLKPYLKPQDINGFVPHLLSEYTVKGRLVALPLYVDLGILYYRPDLLQKYGFSHPPDTWEQLETMAGKIQQGERSEGDKNFWGYVWQGAAAESGTCNALEWQASAGAGNFVKPDGIHVRSKAFLRTLQRAANWIGTISPPAAYVYREDDSVNIWDIGHAAFMRNWASAYSHLVKQPGHDHHHFAVAALPGGPGGHQGILGGGGIAVSKYAANSELAIKAALELTSTQGDRARVLATEGIPTHTGVHQAAPNLLLGSLVARPSLVTADKYDAVSLEYATAINSVLRRKSTPEAAMAHLETKLMQLTGLPAHADE